jgi:hypothetical protein
MPTLAELAQLSDNAYVGYPQLQRQAAKMKKAQAGRIPENLPDPRTYGFISGLLGTSPDELGMSVLSPNTSPAKDAAYYGYQLTNLGQMLPAMIPATKAGLNMAGNAINDAMVFGTGPLARITPQPMFAVNPSQSNLGNAQKLSYPQQEALQLAQKRAALPVSEGGLGLLAENTPEMRAQAMGFNTPVYRGHQFGTGRNKNTFYTDNPKIASQYAEKGGNAQYEIKSGGDRYLFDTYEEAKSAQKNDVGGTITKLKNEPTVQANLLRMENPLVVDAKQQNWNWLEDPFKPIENKQSLEKQLANVTKDKIINGRLYTVEQQKQDILRDNYFKVFTDTNRLVEEAKKKGYGNAVIKNVYDTALPIEGNKNNYLSDVYVSMKPENERSRFAAFDPFRKDIATATAMGVALPDLLAQEVKEKKKKTK